MRSPPVSQFPRGETSATKTARSNSYHARCGGSSPPTDDDDDAERRPCGGGADGGGHRAGSEDDRRGVDGFVAAFVSGEDVLASSGPTGGSRSRFLPSSGS
jgi:hypothetical protein